MDGCPAFELRVRRRPPSFGGDGGVPDDGLNPEYACNILLKGIHRI